MILSSILTLGLLALAFGLLLGYAAQRFKVEGNPVVNQIDEVLPQMQCGKCGFAGCHPYAEAVAQGEVEINLCTPGGENVMLALSRMLDRPPKPLEMEQDDAPTEKVAVIDENLCIGCTLCIQACPVDAILGSAKHMHTVIARECTGCELCLPPCPVDCITMQPLEESPTTWHWPAPLGQSVSSQNRAVEQA